MCSLQPDCAVRLPVIVTGFLFMLCEIMAMAMAVRSRMPPSLLDYLTGLARHDCVCSRSEALLHLCRSD